MSADDERYSLYTALRDASPGGKLDRLIGEKDRAARDAVAAQAVDSVAHGRLLRAGVLHLCKMDAAGAALAFDAYEQLCTTFAASPEGKLLRALVTACRNVDYAALTEAVTVYDRQRMIDPYNTTALLYVKQKLQEAHDRA